MANNCDVPQKFRLPSTRYQGSKRKLIPWIYDNIKGLEFKSATDVFGGTGVVSYLLKQMGKRVTYNDYMKFNFNIGKALIENSSVTLSGDDLEFLLHLNEPIAKTFVSDTFSGKYYTNDENLWLDQISSNISRLSERYSGVTLEYKRCVAYYALFQSCLMKRPFNLFHRANLNLRTSTVERTFGNKVTWEKPFESLFTNFVDEINRLVFSNGEENKAVNEDALSLTDNKCDLVYVDPPYFCDNRSDSQCDYGRMYHFLEGLSNYEAWADLIDYGSSTLHLRRNGNNWLEKSRVADNLEQLFNKFSTSTIVLSYKSPGVPTEDEIVCLLKKYKGRVRVVREKYRYALSRSSSNLAGNTELLIIGT